MEEINVVGVDLAKNVFQIHAANAEGRAIVGKRPPRTRFMAFKSTLPLCVVAMEACATSHHWARELQPLGHDVRRIPPIYVKPFVKRQKDDANDAEAIVETAMRPSMPGTRHGISRLPDVEGDKPKWSKFKGYPRGFFHIAIAGVKTAHV